MTNAEQELHNLLIKELNERGYVTRNIKIDEISTEGANYTSKLFTIQVELLERKKLNLFAKVATLNDNLRKRMSADWLYSTERFVYTNLSKTYEILQDKFDIPEEERFKFPKLYGFNSEHGKETIIMENLTSAGYKSFNRFNSMDWEYASSAMNILAKLHALSFAYAKYYPAEFEKAALDREYMIGKRDKADPSLIPMWEKLIRDVVAGVKDDQKQKVRDFLLSSKDFQRYNKPNGLPVLVHGDFRPSNVMFQRSAGKTQSMVVDFQTLHSANPAIDIIYFIFLGSDEQFREKYYSKLLDYYYTKLCSAMERFQVDPLEVYPREKFDEDITKNLPYAILIGVSILPIVTVESCSAPQLEGDADISGFVMSPNELCKSRFGGIINDLTRMGVL